MRYDIIFGCLTTVNCGITTRYIALLVDPGMLEYLQYNHDCCDPSEVETYKLAKEFGQQLVNNTCEVFGNPPTYKDGKDFHFCFRFLV